MAKKLTEEEMLEEALKNPKIRRVWGGFAGYSSRSGSGV